MMIRSLFFPTKFQSYYLFPQRIVGIELAPHEIHATVVVAKRSLKTIEKILVEPIEKNGVQSDLAITNALKALKERIGAYDQLVVAFSSSQVIFKELTLPFTGLKKIKMVIPYEIESSLPFSIEHAIVDGIITKQEKNSTTLLVSAVKKDALAGLMALYESAGFSPDVITIDSLALYALYASVAPASEDTTCLLDIGLYATRLLVIQQNQLRAVRTLQSGLVTIAKKLSTEQSIDVQTIVNQMTRIGLEDTENQSMQKRLSALNELLFDIKMSIDIFLEKLRIHTPLSKIVCLGTAAEIPGVVNHISAYFGVKAELFPTKKIVHNNTISSKVAPLPQNALISLAAALDLPTIEDFNLARQFVLPRQNKLITLQLISIGSVIGLLFLTFFTYSFMQTRGLKKRVQQGQQEGISELKKQFKLSATQSSSLENANKAALNELRKQEVAWHQLTAENRYAFLNYLLELSKCINLKDINLDITTLSLKEDTIKIYGSVPDYQQLNKLQNQLECPLFKKIPKLQDPNFKSEPITLYINKEREM